MKDKIVGMQECCIILTGKKRNKMCFLLDIQIEIQFCFSQTDPEIYKTGQNATSLSRPPFL